MEEEYIVDGWPVIEGTPVHKWIKKGEQQGLEKGIEKGIQQGMEKGIEKGIEQSIKKILLKGKSPEFVADLLDVPLEMVEKVAKGLES